MQEPVQDFLVRHNLQYRAPVPDSSGLKFVLEECPFDKSHKAPDVMVWDRKDGGRFKCLHDSCAGRTWREVRALFEQPGLKDFIEDCCDISEGDFVPAKDLYEAYENWVLRGTKVPDGMRWGRPMRYEAFTEGLISEGLKQSRARRADGKQARTWEGISIKEEPTPELGRTLDVMKAVVEAVGDGKFFHFSVGHLATILRATADLLPSIERDNQQIRVRGCEAWFKRRFEKL